MATLRLSLLAMNKDISFFYYPIIFWELLIECFILGKPIAFFFALFPLPSPVSRFFLQKNFPAKSKEYF